MLDAGGTPVLAPFPLVPLRMFGQVWVEPDLGAGAGRLCVVVVEWVVAVVEELDDAALAIAAPPPTSAPVTSSVVMVLFSIRIGLSPPFV